MAHRALFTSLDHACIESRTQVDEGVSVGWADMYSVFVVQLISSCPIILLEQFYCDVVQISIIGW